MSGRSTKQNGFTLLEILVAASIFSIMSVLALTGIKSVIDSQEQINQVASEIQLLQSTLHYLEQDLQFASNRAVRDEYGDEQAAIKAGNTGLQGLSLTRGGIRNPQGLKRSNLVRVRYWLNENTLMRSRYKSLDRGPENGVIERRLLDQLDEFELRFLNKKNQWLTFWPPVEQADNEPVFPRAIEVTLTHNKMGKIKRLIALPN